MSSTRFPRTVDDVTVRLVAAEVLVVSVLALALQLPWLYGVLAVDFLLRVAYGPRFSPFARLGVHVLRPRLSAEPRLTPGPPKRFAMTIGAVLTTAAFLAYYLAGWSTVTWVIGAVMVVFPALEAFLGICAGCIAFSLLMRAGVIPRSVCEECADIRLRLTPAQRQRVAAVRPLRVADTDLTPTPER